MACFLGIIGHLKQIIRLVGTLPEFLAGQAYLLGLFWIIHGQIMATSHEFSPRNVAS